MTLTSADRQELEEVQGELHIEVLPATLVLRSWLMLVNTTDKERTFPLCPYSPAISGGV